MIVNQAYMLFFPIELSQPEMSCYSDHISLRRSLDNKRTVHTFFIVDEHGVLKYVFCILERRIHLSGKPGERGKGLLIQTLKRQVAAISRADIYLGSQ